MIKILRVAWQEYQINVFKKSFIIVLLSVPLFFAITAGLAILLEGGDGDATTLGYVDQAGILDDPAPAPLEDSQTRVEMIAFASEAQARTALQETQVQAYYLLPPDYLESGNVELVYQEKPGDIAAGQFYDFLQVNLMAGKAPELARRAALGSNVIVYTLRPNGKPAPGGPSLGNLLPLLTGMVLIGLLLTSSGFMMQAVFREKENRVVEVLVTSLSAGEMVAGKVLGVIAISFTQLVIWSLFALLAILAGSSLFGMPWLQEASLNWYGILSVAAIGLPAYAMTSALMFTLGLIVSTPQEGEQFGPLLFLVYLTPLYLLIPIGNNPTHPLAVTLSLLPFSGMLTVGFRSLFMTVPLWQVAASVAIHTLAAALTLWAAQRAFRLGMLRYGKGIRLGEILRRRQALPSQESRHG
ncbi:MAG: ABC transporter permease [Anaerolineales bacterium]|jgi:ABC-2 type transport system permease protein